jgi:argininosuccinate lyase
MRTERFSSPAAEIAQRYSESISFDRRLCQHDIAGTHRACSALAAAGILTANKFEIIAHGLRQIQN